MTEPVLATGRDPTPAKRYRLPGIRREGIAQLSLLETALWPLKGGPKESATFDTSYAFHVEGESKAARVSVYAPKGLHAIDEYVLYGLLGVCLSRRTADTTLVATPYWLINRLGLAMGGFQYDQLRASLERLALVAYQNTAFYNPVSQQHERVTLHFFSCYLPTRGRAGEVDTNRAWRLDWSPTFYHLCQAPGGTLLFDLDLYHDLSPAARRLFLKLKDRFWRSNRVFLNVDDLTVNGLGFSAHRPLKKRKYDLLGCIRELLDHKIIELGPGQTDPHDLFLRRGKGRYVVQFHEGEYFRRPHAARAHPRTPTFSDDPLYQPLRAIGVDEAGIRRLFKQHARGVLQRWIKITDTAMHEHPRGFPGFKTSPAAFLMDAVRHNRMPPDWIHAHDKERQRAEWDQRRIVVAADEQSLREQYRTERAGALLAYLACAEGQRQFAAVHATFLAFYRTVEPDRFRDAAREAAMGKVEREQFRFPEFSVWLLERHAAR